MKNDFRSVITTAEKYVTWFWTRENFLVLSGTVASVGWLKYNQPGKPERVWVDEACLSDPVAMDSLRGKSASIDHTTEWISPANISGSEVGRVSKVWYDSEAKELRCSVLITNQQLLNTLRMAPKTRIGLSPYYYSGVAMKNGRLTQVNRYYNNLSLLFMTVPRGDRSYVFSDAKDRKMTELEQIKQSLAALAAQIDAMPVTPNADSQDSPTGDDPYATGYAEGLKAGVAHGEALAYADSLSIPVLPTDTLPQILEKVATKIAGKAVKAGESAEFYKGLISGNVSVFADSKRINPRQSTQEDTPAAKAEAARQKMLETRYPKKVTA